MDKAYPVGSTYFNKTDSRNPNVILGFGTWVELGGVVLAGKKTEDDTFGNTGTIGAKTHTLTVAQMPSHRHNLQHTVLGTGGGINNVYGSPHGGANANASVLNLSQTTSSGETRFGIYDTGGGQAHNNLQPYQVFAFWKRTA